MMTRHELRRDRAAIEHDFNQQKLAALLVKSGWTQDRLAFVLKMNKWEVARLLLFGRYIAFAPSADLSESEFRKAWNACDKNACEDDRFLAIYDALSRRPAQPKLEFEPKPEPIPISEPEPEPEPAAPVEGAIAETPDEMKPARKRARKKSTVAERKRLAVKEHREKVKAAELAAIARRAARPRITPEQAHRPPDEMARKIEPTTGKTYGMLHTERFGQTFFDQDKRREQAKNKLAHHFKAIVRETSGLYAAALEPEDFKALAPEAREAARAFFAAWRKAKRWIRIEAVEQTEPAGEPNEASPE